MRHGKPLTAEDVAYWYLRLNGFLILNNFLVHGDRRGETRTEIDILGVRFRNRREHLALRMRDDDWIEQAKGTILVFCDAKNGPQDFRDSWANKEKQVMESFLALVGVLPKKRWKDVAGDLYNFGRSEPRRGLLITTFLINHDLQGKVQHRWPKAKRVQLTHALKFVHERFEKYRSVKTDHGQWNLSGHLLWDMYDADRYNTHEFTQKALSQIGAS